jgi:hypothetical protein
VGACSPHERLQSRQPSVLGFHLVSSSRAAACAARGRRHWDGDLLYAREHLYACSAECAAELGHTIGTEPLPKCDRAATLRARQRDVVTVFRAAGLV